MSEITPEELARMIADLSLTDNWPPRERLCLALIMFRELLQKAEAKTH